MGGGFGGEKKGAGWLLAGPPPPGGTLGWGHGMGQGLSISNMGCSPADVSPGVGLRVGVRV